MKQRRVIVTLELMSEASTKTIKEWIRDCLGDEVKQIQVNVIKKK